MSMSKPVMSLAEKTAHKRNLIRIRLARFGRKHQPIYNIVVMKAKKAQQKVPIEVIGTYNSVPTPQPSFDKSMPVKDISLDFHRAKYWLGRGAEPTDRVAWLFKKAGILPSFWPSSQNITQEILSPVVEDIRETQELPVENIRRRNDKKY
ncbi:MRPS16 [Candida oxycetoniae]|uniref:MRPS16 n=1 Tax=Candida oxycetoniae TaxID=497107 RepID=A0AAI9SXQ5_9ASCO|nr:MRPS16 [Candida oxycetoniae]KAI3404780.1 MRPS16 [Candida oxycetoniae]